MALHPTAHREQPIQAYGPEKHAPLHIPLPKRAEERNEVFLIKYFKRKAALLGTNTP
jgi:hypothetical protein